MKDITGQRFGNLVVQGLDQSIRNVGYKGSTYIYRCLCDCGNVSLVRRGNLISGHTKSCGCMRGLAHREKMREQNDLTGRVFGRLLVLGRDVENFKKFACQCECGKITSVVGHDLKTGHTRSCGCLQVEVSSSILENMKREIRSAKGLDPEKQIGTDNDLQRALFRSSLQQEILQRDDYSCLWCSDKGVYLNVHHLQTWKACPERRFDPTNLVTLCQECHKKIHHRSYHKNVDPYMTILLEGYSNLDDYNLTEYHTMEKALAARMELSAE